MLHLLWNSNFRLKLKPKKNRQIQFQPSKCFSSQSVCVYSGMCVCVCELMHIQCVSARLFICWMHVCLSMGTHTYQFTCRLFTLWVILMSVYWGVDEMCSMQSSSAHQEWAKSSQAESSTVLFHHHPHCGNVRPRGHCQSSWFCYLLGSQPVRNWGERKERRRRPGSSLGKEQRK